MSEFVSREMFFSYVRSSLPQLYNPDSCFDKSTISAILNLCIETCEVPNGIEVSRYKLCEIELSRTPKGSKFTLKCGDLRFNHAQIITKQKQLIDDSILIPEDRPSDDDGWYGGGHGMGV